MSFCEEANPVSPRRNRTRVSPSNSSSDATSLFRSASTNPVGIARSLPSRREHTRCDSAPMLVDTALQPGRLRRMGAGKGSTKLLLGCALLFVAYFGTAHLGLFLGAVAGFATLVWPPTGIALVALYLYGVSLWPAVFAGALLVNLVHRAPLLVAFAI